MTTLRARFAAFVLRIAGWTAVGEVPRTGILAQALHGLRRIGLELGPIEQQLARALGPLLLPALRDIRKQVAARGIG